MIEQMHTYVTVVQSFFNISLNYGQYLFYEIITDIMMKCKSDIFVKSAFFLRHFGGSRLSMNVSHGSSRMIILLFRLARAHQKHHKGPVTEK